MEGESGAPPDKIALTRPPSRALMLLNTSLTQGGTSSLNFKAHSLVHDRSWLRPLDAINLVLDEEVEDGAHDLTLPPDLVSHSLGRRYQVILAVKCLPTLYTLSKMRGTQNMMDGFRTVASPFSPLFTMVLL